MTDTVATLPHFRAIDPERQRDFLFRTDGAEIPLEITAPAETAFGPVRHEKAQLPQGSYWWVRLTNGVLEAIELIQFLPNQPGGSPVNSHTEFRVGPDGDFMDVLTGARRMAHLPDALLARLEPAA